MFFLLLRILAWLLPLTYFFIFKSVTIWPQAWAVFMLALVLIDFVYFLILRLKTGTSGVWLVFLHSLVFCLVGFGFFLFLSSKNFILSFSIGWSVIYLIYLESSFHFFYQTDKVALIDFKNVVAFVNLILVFFASACLMNLYIFLNWNPAWAWLLFSLGFWLLMVCRFYLEQWPWRSTVVTATILTLLAAEIFVALFLLPFSIFLLSLALALVYYLFSFWSILQRKGVLTRMVVLKYSLFASLILAASLITATWL